MVADASFPAPPAPPDPAHAAAPGAPERDAPEAPPHLLAAPGERATADGRAPFATEPHASPPSRPAAERWLEPRHRDAASAEPIDGMLALIDALLKSPARVLATLDTGASSAARLALLAAAALALTGVGVASFAGDLQLLVVPVKIVLGTCLAALLCLPSLHVFSCLSGAQQSLGQTAGALLMGVALMGILLCGFAPVVWVFAQATTSPEIVGTLHLAFFFASAALGLGLTRRSLAALNGAPVAAAGPWCLMFVLVLCQLSTTLRPLVGAFDGVLLHERMFFLAHWLS